jgi:hypothetical protein
MIEHGIATLEVSKVSHRKELIIMISNAERLIVALDLPDPDPGPEPLLKN